MTFSKDDLLNSILASLDRIDYIAPEEIPDIDLYVDQVTTMMDSRLRNTTRYPDEDKILTKTMINNYAKNDLLPPPVKKKYSKEHILLLIFIYYFKGILSINDIQKILGPITEMYFGSKEGLTLEDVYREVFGMESEAIKLTKEDIRDKFEKAQGTFENAGEDKEFLQMFSFICLLSFDVYVKRLMIEKLLDTYDMGQKSPDDKGK